MAAPTLSNASLVDETHLVAYFDQYGVTGVGLSEEGSGNGGFTIGGGSLLVTGWKLWGPCLVLALSGTASSGATITLSHTGPAFFSTDPTPMANFAGMAVANRLGSRHHYFDALGQHPELNATYHLRDPSNAMYAALGNRNPNQHVFFDEGADMALVKLFAGEGYSLNANDTMYMPFTYTDRTSGVTWLTMRWEFMFGASYVEITDDTTLPGNAHALATYKMMRTSAGTAGHLRFEEQPNFSKVNGEGVVGAPTIRQYVGKGVEDTEMDGGAPDDDNLYSIISGKRSYQPTEQPSVALFKSDPRYLLSDHIAAPLKPWLYRPNIRVWIWWEFGFGDGKLRFREVRSSEDHDPIVIHSNPNDADLGYLMNQFVDPFQTGQRYMRVLFNTSASGTYPRDVHAYLCDFQVWRGPSRIPIFGRPKATGLDAGLGGEGEGGVLPPVDPEPPPEDPSEPPPEDPSEPPVEPEAEPEPLPLTASFIATLAQEMTDAINAASLDMLFGNHRVKAKRKWLPIVKLEELIGTLVLVVPRGVTTTAGSRMHDFEDVEIDVGFFRLMGDNQDREMDELFALMQRVHGVLRRPFAGANAGWQGRASDPIFDVTSVGEKRTLRAATTYRYRVTHDVRV